MIVITLRNITRHDECYLDLAIKKLGYQPPEDFGYLSRTRDTVHDDRSALLRLGVYSKKMLEDPRIKELLLEHLL